MWCLFHAWLVLAVPNQVVEAASNVPDAAELSASEAVLDASEPEQRAKSHVKDAESGILEVTWSSLLSASGGEPDVGLGIDATGAWRVDDLLRPRASKLYPSTTLAIYGEYQLVPWLLLRGLIDTREIRDGETLDPPLQGVTMNGSPALDELGSLAVVRELSAVFGSESITVEVGRFRADVAEGLVYRDYGAGVRFRVDLQSLNVAPLQVELLATTVGQRTDDIDNNQLMAVRVDWMLSSFEYLGAFAALARDAGGEFSDVLRSAYAENLLEDRQKLDALFLQDGGNGMLGYVGLSTQLIPIDGAVLRARVALATGALKLRVPVDEITNEIQVLGGQTIKLQATGFAADAELRYGVSDGLELAGFAFLLSGDTPPQQDGDRFRSFIGVGPDWQWTGIFFSGGIAQGLYPTRSTAAGVHGRGVIGFGPSLTLSNDSASTELRAMVLCSTTDPPAAPRGRGSRVYGVEIDWVSQWQAVSWLGLGAELDGFIPGHFFASSRFAYLALAMVTVSNAQ
jgi:hypothetical protein